MKRIVCASLFLATLSPVFAQGAAETTAFPGEEYMAFSISTIDQECKVQWAFETAVAQQGQHGTATAGQAQLPHDGCPGLFPFAVGRYKWTLGDTALKDSFVLNVKFPPNQGGWQPVTVPVKRAAVEVKSLSLEKGTAVLNLNGGLDTAGTLTFDFETAGGFVSSQTTATYYQPGSAISVGIDRPTIKKGKYSKVNVTWNTLTYRMDSQTPIAHAVKTTYTPSKPWNVLGVVRYSQYNVANEAKCTGAAVQKWVVDSVTQCNFSQTLFKSDFLDFTSRNGTGKSSNFGYLKPGAATSVATSCADEMPPNVNIKDIYVQVDSVTGACNSDLLGGVSVATFAKNCTGKETLVKSNNKLFQKRDVDDKCPACDADFRGTDGHIDAFANVDSCDPHDIPDLGNYWTLQQP
ncbi:hypothetical protein [Ideonella sp.]|uniref:hypothetical protein n=1 Tax=Ideonella sp. TaxID=1929293 RepID=UPI0035B0CF1A